MKKPLIISVILFKSMTAFASPEKPLDLRCNEFFAKTEKFESEQSTRKQFASEHAALQELRLASEYPEFPQDQTASLKAALKPVTSEGSSRLARFDSGELGCDPVRYFVWLRRLIRSGKKYHFSAEDRHRLAPHLMTHLRSDAEGPKPLLNLSLDLKLIREANEDSALHLSAEKTHQLDMAMSQLASAEKVEPKTEEDFEDIRSTAGDPITSDIEKQREQRLIQILQTELRLSEQIRSTLRSLLDLPPDDSLVTGGRSASVSSSEL